MIAAIRSALARAIPKFGKGQTRKSSAYTRNYEPLPFDTSNVNKVTLGFFLMTTSGTLAPYLVLFFQLSKNK